MGKPSLRCRPQRRPSQPATGNQQRCSRIKADDYDDVDGSGRIRFCPLDCDWSPLACGDPFIACSEVVPLKLLLPQRAKLYGIGGKSNKKGGLGTRNPWLLAMVLFIAVICIPHHCLVLMATPSTEAGLNDAAIAFNRHVGHGPVVGLGHEKATLKRQRNGPMLDMALMLFWVVPLAFRNIPTTQTSKRSALLRSRLRCWSPLSKNSTASDH